MNEQLIGDLFAEATRQMTGSSSREFSQKFTKLIVQECIAQCEKNKDHEGLGSGSKLSAFNIKEHFGVEE